MTTLIYPKQIESCGLLYPNEIGYICGSLNHLINTPVLSFARIIPVRGLTVELSFTHPSAPRQLMNSTDRVKPRLLASFLLPAAIMIAGTASGAQTVAPAPGTIGQPAVQANNPELDNADQRVNDLKAKLETARKQLSAAKAIVKAAEAEFKAARADRDAIALRASAQQLADASGFPVTTTQDANQRTIIVPAGGGTRLTPVDMTKSQVAPAAVSNTPVPLTPTMTAQPFPFNSQPSVAPAPAENDLRPSLNVNEPNSVP